MATNNSWNDDIEAANSNITLNAGTNTINISSDSTNCTVNLGTGTGNKSVTVGAASSSSTTLITSGSGGVTLASNSSNSPITFSPNGTGVVTTPNAFQSASISFDGGTNKLSNYVTTTSWTPVLAFGGASVGISYSAQQGLYTRIGNQVYFWVIIGLSSKGSSTGAATITGHPVAVGTSFVADYIFNIASQSLTFSNQLGCYFGSGGNLNIISFTTAGFTSLTNTAFAATTEIIISGSYSAV
jgi:hypothetical protein